jgi:hypothetical protein
MTVLIRLEKLAELSRFSGDCQSECGEIRPDYPPITAIFGPLAARSAAKRGCCIAATPAPV